MHAPRTTTHRTTDDHRRASASGHSTLCPYGCWRPLRNHPPYNRTMSSAEGQGQTICVVLVPDAVGLDGWLGAEIAGRGWRPIVRRDPLMAMAELCLRKHLGAMPRAGEAPPAQETVLLVEQSLRWGSAGPLLAAAQRYLPGLSTYVFDDERQRMTALAMPVTPPPPPASSVTAPPRVGDARESDAAPQTPRVTREEIEMLLAPPGA